MKTLTKALLSAAASSVVLHRLLGLSYLFPLVVHAVFCPTFVFLLALCDAAMMQTASDECTAAYDKKVDRYLARAVQDSARSASTDDSSGRDARLPRQGEAAAHEGVSTCAAARNE